MLDQGAHLAARLPDLPAPAWPVSRLALQDDAELLEEEHKGTTLLPGNTHSPFGITAGATFETDGWQKKLWISGGNPYLPSGWSPPLCRVKNKTTRTGNQDA